MRDRRVAQTATTSCRIKPPARTEKNLKRRWRHNLLTNFQTNVRVCSTVTAGPTTLNHRVQLITHSLIAGSTKAIRQRISSARDNRRQQPIYIQRTKPNTRHAIAPHISANIYFGKRTEIRHTGQTWHTNAAHRKRNQTNPRRAVANIYFESVWQNSRDLVDAVAKMNICEVIPTLFHHRAAHGLWANF